MITRVQVESCNKHTIPPHVTPQTGSLNMRGEFPMHSFLNLFS